jgi:hypothetical protein
MLCPTRTHRKPAHLFVNLGSLHASRVKLWWLPLLVWVGACNESDVGRCCDVVPGGDESLIPQPRVEGGTLINDIRQDPGFDCSSLTCVTFLGSEAYCTAPCDEADDCPDGFTCRSVLTSTPAPDASIQPSDRFCVLEPIGTSTTVPGCFE